MSPRAAVRLEHLGFDRVHDFPAGKMGWLAAGLPRAGDRSDGIRVGDLARSDPPICGVDEDMGALGGRRDPQGWNWCVVTDDDGVVHGLLTPVTLSQAGESTPVSTVMETGPTTIRPSASPESALDRMDEAGVEFLLVTTEFGVLLGVLHADDVEDFLNAETPDPGDSSRNATH